MAVLLAGTFLLQAFFAGITARRTIKEFQRPYSAFGERQLPQVDLLHEYRAQFVAKPIRPYFACGQRRLYQR